MKTNLTLKSESIREEVTPVARKGQTQEMVRMQMGHPENLGPPLFDASGSRKRPSF